MNADEFRDYILGFIFYKYLSEKMEIFADGILKQDKLVFKDISPKMPQYDDYLAEIRHESLDKLGYFLRPDELFGHSPSEAMAAIPTKPFSTKPKLFLFSTTSKRF
jgi:type I restriction-modification system DNA methylase subunit